MSLEHEHELVQRIAAGDQNALVELYRAYESRVYAYALKKVNDPHAAADILNEVMMAAWIGAARFKGKAKVSTWLLGIAHHKMVDYVRKQIRHEAEELHTEIEDENTMTSLEIVASAENMEGVKSCMKKLSAEHSEVVHLSFFEDLSYGEISNIIGRPEGTIKTRMYHAKQALKKCLERLLQMANSHA
jgi:RNA polymerase sigma-70 factor (ECF subfamily)